MKKFIAIALLAAVVSTSAFAAERQPGGFMGGIHGCCFGLRGAAAYNDGKEMTTIEWVDALVTGHIIAFIKGWGGITTADLVEEYGTRYF